MVTGKFTFFRKPAGGNQRGHPVGGRRWGQFSRSRGFSKVNPQPNGDSGDVAAPSKDRHVGDVEFPGDFPQRHLLAEKPQGSLLGGIKPAG
jgi:hypothetical protein